MKEQKLFMLLVGATPKGRHTEQHDVFFGIGDSLIGLVPSIDQFWPEAQGRIHIDAWREVTHVDGFDINVRPRTASAATPNAGTSPRPDAAPDRLFFINLGGYKPGDFEEYHYKTVVAGPDKGAAVKKAKETSFYKHIGFKGAESHIDDKYGIDVDDAHEIADILLAGTRQAFMLEVTPSAIPKEDELHIGYLQLSKLR